MIQLIGVDHNTEVDIREKFSIVEKRVWNYLKKLKNILDEVVIINTCNRVELYFKTDEEYQDVKKEIFNIMEWDIELEKHLFYKKDREAVEHIMFLSAGFESLLKGEEQISTQIKTAYNDALRAESVSGNLTRLFRKAIACGKDFRTKVELYKIPVSSSSIAIDDAISKKMKNFMLIGFGKIGQLNLKHLSSLEDKIGKIYIVTRHVTDEFMRLEKSNDKIKIIKYSERYKYYQEIDCILSSTSAPHAVIVKNHNLKGKTIYDMAVPRDVSSEVYLDDEIEVLNIDDLEERDTINKKKREELMNKNRWIVQSYIEEFYEWKSVEEYAKTIKSIVNKSEKEVEKRAVSFLNRKDSQDIDELAKTMIKSASNYYVEKAIRVLKREAIEGRGEECIKIIKEIFC